ncbi:MAG: protein phosphatase [Oscillospiraceae bacterium]|nr:protein phosphatase [Oscillospiraceae bacterium]
MPNSAEIIERLAIQSTCQKILLTIKEDCKTLEDVERYVLQLLNESEKQG